MRWFLLIFLPQALLADWREAAGYPQLQAEMGASLPTGAGITLMMSEASLAPQGSPILYLPQATTGSTAYAGAGEWAGKTLYPRSGASGASGHAASVAALFCGLTQSVSPGVTDLEIWSADEWALDLYNNTPLPTYPGSIHNHSWVGDTLDDAVNTEVLRRLDSLVNRDKIISLTPLNNGSTMMKLTANAYHGITAGLLNGNHPHTHTNLDVSGRMKPDLVVDLGVTSQASPAIGSACAVLLDAIRPAFPTADDPRLVKALLLTAASKDHLPGWRRLTSSRPYDENYGAGELQLRQALHLLQGGRVTASNSILRPSTGWDVTTVRSTTPRLYFFSIPQGTWARTFSASLTWHRSISANFTSVALSNLSLKLYHAQNFTLGTVLDQSISTLDNVEHLFQRHLPAGEYALEVNSAALTQDTYGLAWQALNGLGPQVSATRSGTVTTLTLTDLDPWETYTVQASQNLVNWTDLTTLAPLPATPTQTRTYADSTTPAWSFFRLHWEP